MLVLILFDSQEYLSIPALNNFVAAYTPSLNRFFALLVVHLPSYFTQKRPTPSLTDMVSQEEDLLVPIPVPNTKVLGSNGLTNGTDSSWMYNSGNSTLNPKYHATDNNGLYVLNLGLDSSFVLADLSS
jgi:hypothetical protein